MDVADLAARLDRMLLNLPADDPSHVCAINNGPRAGERCPTCKKGRYERQKGMTE